MLTCCLPSPPIVRAVANVSPKLRPITIQSSYSATLGISAYELDLFGRVRSLSEQAMQTYLASEEARRSTQITLVANVANAYLAWRADQELLMLTQKNLAADTESLHLTSRSNQISRVSTLPTPVWKALTPTWDAINGWSHRT